MDHNEAVQHMAVERYLLEELSPDLRDAFEEHLFDCPECTLELRVTAAFVDEAKAQLPEITAPSPLKPSQESPRQAINTAARASLLERLFGWLRPAIAGPVFAALLLVIGYQNLVTLPSLRSAVGEPRLLPSVVLHAGTRGAEATVIEASRAQGFALLVDLPQEISYTSYDFTLYDANGKPTWSQTYTAPRATEAGDMSLTLAVPGAGLQQASYSLAVSGVTASGLHTEIERQNFDIHLSH